MSGSRNSYAFRITAEGFAEFTADLQKLSGQSEAAQRAINTLVQSSPQLASSMNTAAEATQRAAERAKELREAQERAATSSAAMVPAARTAGQALEGLEAKASSAQRVLASLGSAMGTEAGGLGALFTGLSQNLGTVAGNATRVESVMAVLGSRMAMLAGLASLPILLQSVGLGISTIGDNSSEAARHGEAWQRILDGINDRLLTTKERAFAAAQAIRTQTIETMRVEAGQEAEFRGTTYGEALNLGPQINRARTAAEAARQRLDNFNLMAATNPRLQVGGAGSLDLDVQRTQAELDRLQRRRDAYDEEITRRSGEIDRVRKEIERLQNEPIVAPAEGGNKPGGRSGRTGPEVDENAFANRQTERIQRSVDAQLAAERRARELIASDEARDLERREQANNRTTDRITDYLANGFTTAFEASGRGFRGMMENFEQLARRTFIRLAAEAVIRPIIEPVVSAFSLGGATAQNGMTQAGGSILSSLGLGNIGGSINAFGASMAPGLFGGAAAGGGLTAAEIAAPGMFAEAAPSAMGLGGAAAGGTTLLGAAGGLAGGFALGSMLGQFTSNGSAARAQNGMIGAGVGSLAGMAAAAAFGGPLGLVGAAVLGGALGGAGGGLIGPGEGFAGGDALLGFDANGQLAVTGYAGKNFEASGQLMQQAQQQSAALNAQLAGAGLSFSGRTASGGFAAALGGGESPNPTDIGGALSAFGFNASSLTSGDANVQTALGRLGGAGIGEAVQAATWVTQVYNSLTAIANPADEFDQAITRIRDGFTGAIAEAERLGLSTAALTAAQQRQIDAVEAERTARKAAEDEAKNAPARALLEQLTFGGMGGLSPEARATAARRAITGARGPLFQDGATAGEISEFSRVVQAALPVIQQTEGITTNFAALTAMISDTLRQVAPGADVANLAGVIDATRNSGDQITSAVYSLKTDFQTLSGELATLAEQVRVLAARGQS